MEIVYIDQLFLVNLVSDYLLCLAAGRVMGLRLRRRRYFLAALLGALYAVAVYLPGLGFLALPGTKLASGLAMGLIAYGGERRPLRCTAAFFAVSAAFGGALWAVSMASGGGGRAYLDTRVLVLSFALCYGAGSLLFRCVGKLPTRRRVTVRAVFLGRKAEFTALVDTGNGLSDPATGAPVLIASPRALKPLFRENTELFSALSPLELMELSAQLPELRGRLRLVPYTAVGSSGLLPAFRPESLTVDGKADRDRLIAVSAGAVGEGFEAVI